VVCRMLGRTSESVHATGARVVKSWPNAQNPAGCEVVASPTQIIADFRIGNMCSTIPSQHFNIIDSLNTYHRISRHRSARHSQHDMGPSASTPLLKFQLECMYSINYESSPHPRHH